jgi:purine-binding chemotaxis protein CheW
VAEPIPGAVDFEALHRRLDEAEARLAGDAGGGARRREVLEERGRAIATSRQAVRAESEPVLAFTVGGERYAVEVAAVSQVLEARGLQPLLAAPPWLLGAMVARTRVVPVLDLRQLLGLSGGGMSDLGKVIVVEHEGEAFGIAAETLEGRLEVARAGLAASSAGPFHWVAPDRLALLDLAQLGVPGLGEGASHGG